ncbi:hypothetical protein [Pseudonocardia sp. TRM90224]|uniref:hypothetical protein n=1 Tax=Pseudonocardia sp. TRM90224 TaxID=2812678 RepID=UPI001E4103BC|nr:hypothetical protein [Pseudonocardia sp. TRM90224]
MQGRPAPKGPGPHPAGPHHPPAQSLQNQPAQNQPAPNQPGSGRAAPPPAHPLRGDGDDPPPPRREQLPLPRRDGGGHIEPQLRQPRTAGNGTPFTPFAADSADAEPKTDEHPVDRAAAFYAATRRWREGGQPWGREER